MVATAIQNAQMQIGPVWVGTDLLLPKMHFQPEFECWLQTFLGHLVERSRLGWIKFFLPQPEFGLLILTSQDEDGGSE